MASSINIQEWQTLKEKVEILAGERGNPEFAAIRVRVLGQLQELISKLRISAKDLQNDINTIDQNLQGTQTQLDTLESSVTFLQNDVNAVQTDVTTLQTDISTIQTGLSTAQTTLTQLDADIATLQSDVGGLATLSTRFDQMQTDVTGVSIPSPAQGTIAAAPTAAQFNGLVSDIAALTNAVTALKNAIIV